MNKFVKFFCGKGSSIAYGGISVIFTIVPESFFHCSKLMILGLMQEVFALIDALLLS